MQIFIIYYGLGQLRFSGTMISSGGSSTTAMRNPRGRAQQRSLHVRDFARRTMSIPHGELEAARACGMSNWVRFRRIRLPLAIRQALPAYGNEITIIIKESSLASTITVLEITGHAKRLMSETFAVIEILTIAGLLYCDQLYRSGARQAGRGAPVQIPIISLATSNAAQTRHRRSASSPRHGSEVSTKTSRKRRDDQRRWATDVERQVDRGETPSESRISRLKTFGGPIDLHIDDMCDVGTPLRSKCVCDALVQSMV